MTRPITHEEVRLLYALLEAKAAQAGSPAFVIDTDRGKFIVLLALETLHRKLGGKSADLL